MEATATTIFFYFENFNHNHHHHGAMSIIERRLTFCQLFVYMMHSGTVQLYMRYTSALSSASMLFFILIKTFLLLVLINAQLWGQFFSCYTSTNGKRCMLRERVIRRYIFDK